MVRQTFALDDRLDLPKRVVTRRFPEGDLHVAPESPNWLLTSELESALLQGLVAGKSIREAAASIAAEYPVAAIEKGAVSLLQKIEEFSFYEGRTEKDEGRIALHAYLTNDCNLRCRHCYKNAGTRMEDELTTGEWCSVIDGFTDAQQSSVVILSGGEVLKRPDFFDIAQYAKAEGHRVRVVTNGVLIQDRATARRLAETCDFLQISLDGPTAATNDYYRGKGTFEQIVSAVNQFEGLDYTVNIGMVVSEKNIEDIKENLGTLLNDTLKHKRIKLNVSGVMDYGRGKYCAKEAKTLGYDVQFIDGAFKAAQKAGVTTKPWRMPNTKATDCGYARSVTVNPDGEVFYCPVATSPLSANLNVRTTSMRDIVKAVRERNRQTSVDLMPGCEDCDLKYICAGGCRLSNITERASPLQPACSEERKEFIYKELIKVRRGEYA